MEVYSINIPSYKMNSTTDICKSIFVSSINNNDGTLDCGCIDICRGVCYLYHKKKKAVYNPTVLTIREQQWFNEQVERIKGFENCAETCRECYWCSKKYPIAFFLFPTDKEGDYEPYCIPCLQKLANPTATEYSDSVEFAGKNFTEKVYASFKQHIIDVVRHPEVPLARILLGWHDPLRTGMFLDKPYYFFQFEVE
jgi:hypothetical protein